MPSLDEVLGAVFTSIARARVLADEETVAIAERYLEHPLLRTMAVPRVRIPEVTIELPLVVDGHDPGKKGTPEGRKAVEDAVVGELKTAASDLGKRPPSGMIGAFRKGFVTQLAGRTPDADVARDDYAAAADRALTAVLRDTRFARAFTADQGKRLQVRLRTRARQVAVKVEAVPSKVAVQVVTAAISATDDPSQVTRLRITAREEGLEWALYEREDGTEARTLTLE